MEEGVLFHAEQTCVSSFDLETCSKVIDDSAIGQNTYDFLLVFYSKFTLAFNSYCLCAKVDFMPK